MAMICRELCLSQKAWIVSRGKTRPRFHGKFRGHLPPVERRLEKYLKAACVLITILDDCHPDATKTTAHTIRNNLYNANHYFCPIF